MIYLGNGIYSDAGSSLSHGGPWKDHKYIKIVNGRYIYPDDVRGNNSPNNLSGRGRAPSKSADRFNSDGKWVSTQTSTAQGTHSLNGFVTSTAASDAYWNKKKEEIDAVLDKQDKNGTSVSVTKYAKRPDGKDPNPKPGDHQHNIGKAPNSRAPRDNGNISGTRFYAKNKKFNKAVSSQGPSAAESAQRGMTKGSSKNVSTGSKTVQYQKKLSDTNKTYQKAVSSQGPSAAEKAQREKGSKKKPKSKNVNTGKPNKKKKNPFKKAISWITGSEGKVSVKK